MNFVGREVSNLGQKSAKFDTPLPATFASFFLFLIKITQNVLCQILSTIHLQCMRTDVTRRNDDNQNYQNTKMK